MLSLIEFCEALSISVATGRNWIKSGRLVPDIIIKNKPFFKEDQLKKMVANLAIETKGPLKSRRNKSKQSGSSPYLGYLPKEEGFSLVEKILVSLPNDLLSPNTLRLILAEYALQLLFGARKISGQADGSLLYLYGQGKYLLGPYQPLLDDLIGNQPTWREDLTSLLPILSYRITYRRGVDFLGLLYLSLKDIGKRKREGAYYTPHFVTDQVVEHLVKMELFSKKTVLDPACGTGNFLLNLASRGHSPQYLYGQDVDPIAVQIARINLACTANIEDLSLLYRNITCGDSLKSLPRKKYDVIVGNPPWGAYFSREEKKLYRLRYHCAEGQGWESAALFLEAALSHLTPEGILSFLLPQAILNIASYECIRTIIAQKGTILSVSYLGDLFYQVQCPAVILTLQSTPSNGEGKIRITKGEKTFFINRHRQFDTACFSFSVTEDEMSLLHFIEEVSPRTSLKGHADFALGIVTGNNRKFVKRGPSPDGETVLKGSHIFQYRIAPSPYTLAFKPDQFQQTASESLYRSPEKLLYRFISNYLIFAYDNRQTLSLNSVNLLIPKIENMNILYILALLNSQVMQFYYVKKFDSVKVLRSHLEQLPLPIPPQSVQDDICHLASTLLDENDPALRKQLYDQIEELVGSLYGLSPTQRLLLQRSIPSPSFL
jgi:SAM-dependent methyltransferase